MRKKKRLLRRGNYVKIAIGSLIFLYCLFSLITDDGGDSEKDLPKTEITGKLAADARLASSPKANYDLTLQLVNRAAEFELAEGSRVGIVHNNHHLLTKGNRVRLVISQANLNELENPEAIVPIYGIQAEYNWILTEREYWENQDSRSVRLYWLGIFFGLLVAVPGYLSRD